jgi:hypothetical protein
MASDIIPIESVLMIHSLSIASTNWIVIAAGNPFDRVQAHSWTLTVNDLSATPQERPK